jgi:hypothetical protein
MNYWILIQLFFVLVILMIFIYQVFIIMAAIRAKRSSGIPLPSVWKITLVASVLLSLVSIIAIVILR